MYIQLLLYPKNMNERLSKDFLIRGWLIVNLHLAKIKFLA